MEDVTVVDALQDVLHQSKVPFDRISADELVIELQGEWAKYSMFVSTKKQTEVQISSGVSIKLPKKKRQRRVCLASIYELINLIHCEPIEGKFYCAQIDGRNYRIVWSYAFPLSADDAHNLSQVEDLLDLALDEIDDNYPAFQMVLSGTVSADDAYDYAIPGFYGHA